MDKEKLKQIIDEVKEATKGLKMKDCEIADFAVRIYISSSIEQGKDKRTEQMQPAKKNFEPATPKQKDYLRGLGIDFPKDISKFEAHKLIEENKGKI